ncbi:MAG TPA: histidine kinase dimerization/phospho-acceptor domain-containing protein, partial [Actinomycetota bacterium]|nr:histidine kinase dimerization/phospho-acceptor domain-containing protein [Actinomycetota bacterium]
MPIRVRLTLVVVALTAVVLAGLGLFVFAETRQSLQATVDRGLRSQAQAIVTAVQAGDLSLPDPGALVEPEEAFAQLLRRDGRVLESTPGMSPAPLLSASEARDLAGPRASSADVRGPEEILPARLLAVPATTDLVVVAGTSVEDELEVLARLRTQLSVGGLGALLASAAIGWIVSGAALRPVERMRREAERISTTDLERRLPQPATRDELARLGTTLNAMLERLRAGVERERRLVDDASHELRTPLAILKTELELALRRARTPEELQGALSSASEETERLSRLAEDLLVLARADRGRLPIHRESVDVRAAIGAAVEPFRAAAAARRVALEVDAAGAGTAALDPL